METSAAVSEPAVSEPAEPLAEPIAEPEWQRHENGRWVLGDAGRQPETRPAPSTVVAPGRPDTVVDGGRLGALSYRATSLRGLGHQQNGTPRQDSYLVRPTRDESFLVGCVCDGVSEQKRSHEAADVVCDVITKELVAAFAAKDFEADPEDWESTVDRLPWQAAVDAASRAVVAAAEGFLRRSYTLRNKTEELERLDAKPFDAARARQVMSTTAVAFVVATQPRQDGRFPLAMAVAAGDSSVMLLTGEGWEPLTAIKNEGEDIASSAVSPLPREATVEPIARYLCDGDVLAVVTDGIGDPLGRGQGVVGRFLAKMWREPPDLLAFAQHAAFYRKSFSDDRTAVVVWPQA